MTVCDDCKHLSCEEITKGLIVDFCEEESNNFQTADGCLRFEERKEDL